MLDSELYSAYASSGSLRTKYMIYKDEWNNFANIKILILQKNEWLVLHSNLGDKGHVTLLDLA